MSSYSEIYKLKKNGSQSTNGMQLRHANSTQNISHKNNVGYIEGEQRQNLLLNNIHQNMTLKFNSPNYRVQNPITQQNMPIESAPKQGKKISEFSGVDHLSGYPIPEQKRIANQGLYKSYENGKPNKEWKPSKKIPENQNSQQIEKIEQNKLKMTDYNDRYKRNPILEGDEVVKCEYLQKISSRVLQKQSSVADQKFSHQTQILNEKRLGLEGQSLKRMYKNDESTADRVFSPRRVNLQQNAKFWGESKDQPIEQNNLNIDSNKNRKDFKQSVAPEVWPLRTDIPKKKEINSEYVKSQKTPQNTVFHVMHYEYGMPHKQQFTDKINRNNKNQLVDFNTANQQKNFKRTGNVLMKEEGLALQRVRSAEKMDYNKFY